MIFFLFKPIKVPVQKSGEIALLKLEKFKITELSDSGLLNILDGEQGLRYPNKYIVKKFNYVDNENEYLVRIKSDKGIYAGDLFDLEGDVVYSRADGISFLSQKVHYNKTQKIVKSPVKFVSMMGENKITGSSIEYNNITGITNSKNVTINYKFKER